MRQRQGQRGWEGRLGCRERQRKQEHVHGRQGQHKGWPGQLVPSLADARMPGCNPCSTSVRWGMSPTAQTGYQCARGWCPPGADQLGGRGRRGSPTWTATPNPHPPTPMGPCPYHAYLLNKKRPQYHTRYPTVEPYTRGFVPTNQHPGDHSRGS